MEREPGYYCEFDNFRLDPRSGVLFRGTEVVDLTPKALNILQILVENSGEIVLRDEIVDRVWPDSFVEEANLSHHIFKLRKALAESDGQSTIETIPKRGYRFVGEVRRINGEFRPVESAVGHPLKPIVSKHRKLMAVITGTGFFILVCVVWFMAVRNPQTSVSTPAKSEYSVAVLPFINESGDENVEYIADGITEGLIGRLSQLSSARVRPRSAVYRYKGNEDLKIIGTELGVRSVLSGRVTKLGDLVRLSLSLMDVETGYQTWGKQYDRSVSSLTSLQPDVISDVSEYLPAKFSSDERERLLLVSTKNSEAYLLYLKGRFQLNRKTEDALKKSIQYFNDAAALDPQFALAYAGLGDAYNQMGLWVTLPPAETFPRARAAAERALVIDEKLAEAHTTLAIQKFYYEWDFAGAERSFKRAIELDPNYPLARESYSIQLYESDPRRIDEALYHWKEAHDADPLLLSLGFWRAAFHYFEGQYDDALKELTGVQQLDPSFTLGTGLKGAVYREKNMLAEYVDHWLSASALEGVDLSTTESERLRDAFRLGGLRNFEVAYAELLTAKAHQKYVSPVFIAMHYSVAGENELALDWLDKAFAERSSWLVELRVDPVWKGLRAEPRFRDLVKKIGFPES